MMTTYKGVLMTVGETKNKTRFSKEALVDIMDTKSKVPVRINFTGDPIGSVKSLDLVGDGIVCTFELNQPNMEQLNLFLVPGGVVALNDLHQDDNGITVIDRMTLTEVSISSLPSDTILTKIEKE